MRNGGPLDNCGTDIVVQWLAIAACLYRGQTTYCMRARIIVPSRYFAFELVNLNL